MSWKRGGNSRTNYKWQGIQELYLTWIKPEHSSTELFPLALVSCDTQSLPFFCHLAPSLHTVLAETHWKPIPLELAESAALLIAYVFRHLSNISSQRATIPSFPPVTKPCTTTENTHKCQHSWETFKRTCPKAQQSLPCFLFMCQTKNTGVCTYEGKIQVDKMWSCFSRVVMICNHMEHTLL